MSQVLEMKFDTANGKTITISVNDPKPDITGAEISSVMQIIMDQDVFHHEGNALIGKNQARIVERNVTEVTLV